MNIWVFSRSDGAGRATTRKTRGLTLSVIALMVPPLPAASRPSNRTMIRAPLLAHPLLQMTEVNLELPQLSFVNLPLHLGMRMIVYCGLQHSGSLDRDCKS